MNTRMKLLCLAPYPVEGASARLRVLQYFPHLNSSGIETSYRPFMSSRFFSSFYTSGRALQKAMYLLRCAVRRLSDVGLAAQYDVVLIHREAALFGPPLVEWLIKHVAKKPVVFDFDDAIHVPYVSPTFGRAASLIKYPQKTPYNIRMSRAVITGNSYLQGYASTLNPNTTLIPTVVDADVVKPRSLSVSVAAEDLIVLGWIGTHSTLPYLEALFPILQEVARRYRILVRIVGAGRNVEIPGVKVDNRKWGLQTEISDLQSFDIGLYPVTEDAWSLGKSGFKAVQYMAVGIPAICSPVGAIRDIVDEGVQGFLCSTQQQWVEQLCRLIEDAELRRQMGQSGRRRVEEWYCLKRQAPRLQAAIEAAAG